MARRNLAEVATPKSSLLRRTAQSVSNYQKQVTQDTNIKDLSEEQKSRLIYLKDDMLLDDPDNMEIYGESDVEALAEDMRKYGFQGVILAYKFGDKYRIESGHRRREAGRKAEIKEYPVFVTDPPKADWERILRLNRANIHGRKYVAMVTARLAQSLFEAHTEEIKYKKANDLVEEGDITSINELVALDLEIDSKTVSKYRALLNLIPELQDLSNEKVAWSALSSAGTLDKDYQHELLELINEKYKKDKKYPDRKWIQQRIDLMKVQQSSGIVGVQQIQNEADSEKGRVRRKNGTKTVINTSKKLREVLDNDAIYKKEEIPFVIETLRNLEKSIEKKLSELEAISDK